MHYNELLHSALVRSPWLSLAPATSHFPMVDAKVWLVTRKRTTVIGAKQLVHSFSNSRVDTTLVCTFFLFLCSDVVLIYSSRLYRSSFGLCPDRRHGEAGSTVRLRYNFSSPSKLYPSFSYSRLHLYLIQSHLFKSKLKIHHLRSSSIQLADVDGKGLKGRC